MKTEKEIKYMLEKALKNLEGIKERFYKTTDARETLELSADWDKVETEIAVLRWVVDE